MIWHSTTQNEVIKELGTDEVTGLSSAEAQKRLEENGPNKLDEKKRTGLIKRFLGQFNDYMIIVLLIAAIVSYVISFLHGDPDIGDALIILAIVVVNAVIGVFQESKAEKALEALKKITASHSKVLRDGKTVQINSEEVVCGDILILKSGDYVPADARIITSSGLKADESSLTGESLPASKNPALIQDDKTPLADRKNMLWASTAIVSGNAEAVVVGTGMDTQVGKIADMIATSESPETPLQKRLAKTGETLAGIALAICAFIFVIGVIKKIPPFDMFMTSVSLAVAAIPEGLPAVVTIMLAIGVQKMAGRNAIIRKLQAVETLGSANVICSDKTGTLTQNKMTVTEVQGDKKQVLLMAALCCNNTDATEKAIISAAKDMGINIDKENESYKRVAEIPFDSINKYMVTTHRLGSNYRFIMKGAPDVILGKCIISDSQQKSVLKAVDEMGQKALRVIAVAYKDEKSTSGNSGYNYVGLIGMIDPPRPEVKKAVALCKNAGIRPVMITGDHINTAVAVAKEIGIKTEHDKAITGAALNEMTDDQLLQNIHHYSVFARVTPKHKVKIVDAFQKRNAVVAMTGDGVNDAPALKKADIGCAMGITGTDVAKGAADMVLTDDNFATIVEAVRLGRGIYSNILKSVHFLLSSNIGEILTILIAIMFGWQAPLIATQLLWVNLVTDSLPAIALGFEKTDEDIMSKKPVNKHQSMFANGLGGTIVLEGIMIGMLAIFAFITGNRLGNLDTARTMAFCVLSLSQLVHAFNVRSEKSVFKAGIFSNRSLVISAVICSILQIAVVMIPAAGSVFKVVPLDSTQWKWVALLSLMPLIIIETVKLLTKARACEPVSLKRAAPGNSI